MANVVFLWHMHQPYYVDPSTKTATMPWVRLHCVKGYLDMISVIEDFPEIHPNFNLTPVLLLQIKELVEGEISDRWLEWSRKPATDLNDAEKFHLLENFFKVNRDTLIRPHARFWELLNKRGLTFYHDDVRRGLRYFTTQEFRDLQVWFNLAWCGFTAFRRYPELAALRNKGRDFTEAEKLRVLEIHLEIMDLVLRKYGEAETRGQVELTTTAFYHPIVPLVYDSDLAKRSMEERTLPNRFHWPEDAEAQLRLAVEQHETLFGMKPRGFWPPEGAIAPEIVPLMEKVGLEYFCTDEENLFHSLAKDPAYNTKPADHLELFQTWQVTHDGASVNAIFREKPLSDFIGFLASRSDPIRAANHLIHHLRHIANQIPRDSGVIPLILDGENAWESFQDGGEAFLRALYGGIASNAEHLTSCTIESCLEEYPPSKRISTLHTGSWIRSNFDVWIGEEEENRAWNLLGRTRSFLQKRIEAGDLTPDHREAALREIYAAEGSDWFWWYGPDFSTENDPLFDELFRQHLKNVYWIGGDVPPSQLDLPIGKIKAAASYEPPCHALTPTINGEFPSHFEWFGAGRYEPTSEAILDWAPDRLLERMYFGFDDDHLYLRIDLKKWTPLSVEVVFFEPRDTRVQSDVLTRSGQQPFTVKSVSGSTRTRDTLAADEIIECSIPLTDLGVGHGDPVTFWVQLHREDSGTETYPESGPIQLNVPTADFALRHWIV